MNKSFIEKSDYRKSVPKTVKDRLWDTTFGPEAGQGICYVCGMQINSKRFEAGHVISVCHGGGTTLDNLKCICSTCNKSMGTQNLEIFKLTYFPAIRKLIKDKKDEKCNCCTYEKNVRKNNISSTDYKLFISKKEIEQPIIYEEELQQIQNIKLNSLNKYKYVPK